jgi:hypothetical protein
VTRTALDDTRDGRGAQEQLNPAFSGTGISVINHESYSKKARAGAQG